MKIIITKVRKIIHVCINKYLNIIERDTEKRHKIIK